MHKRALVEHRPWLLASIAAAIAFYVLRDQPMPDIWRALVKGSAVLALAVYALRRTPAGDGLLLALAMGLSAMGDVGIEFSFELGGAAFFLSHLAAMSLYLRNPRVTPGASQKALAVALLLGTPLISWLLTAEWGIALYALALGGMASTAWMSRFPRYRVGVGAVLFVVSDLLIFSRLSPFALEPLPSLAIWPLYYAGQLLIATGVIQTLRADHDEGD